MTTKFIPILLAALSLAQPLVHAAAKTADAKVALSQHWREKLTPGVEALLNQQCGEDCPSFRIDPRFSTGDHDSIDDVGFSKPVEPDAQPELKGITLTVLYTNAVPEKSRESLRQILSGRVANEAGVPVSVLMQPLSGLSPLQSRLESAVETKTTPSLLPLIRAAAWPACALLVALMALTGLFLSLRARRALALDVLHAQEAAREKREGANAPQDAVAEALTKSALLDRGMQLLESRAADVAWWIEDRASARDTRSLQKCIQLFSAVDLSARIQLSPTAIKALAALDASSQKSPHAEIDALDANAVLEMRAALDGAHWKRLAVEKDPLSFLTKLSDVELGALSASLSASLERAFLLSAVSKNHWPAVLSRLSSEERVQVGLELSRISQQGPDSMNALADTALAAAKQFKGAAGTANLDQLSLYLTEKEVQALRQVSHASNGQHLSSEAILGSMEDSELAELCLRLDIADLRALVRSVGSSERQRIEVLLPKSLRERVQVAGNSRSVPSEAETLRARAAFVSAYRNTFGSEMVQ